jgi:hypothetical protein
MIPWCRRMEDHSAKRRRGRPKKDNSSTQQLGIRCTEEELECWKKAAAMAGFARNVSGWVRSVLNVSAAVEISTSFGIVESRTEKPAGKSPVSERLATNKK